MNFRKNILSKKAIALGYLIAVFSAFAEETLHLEQGLDLPILDSLIRAKRPTPPATEELAKTPEPVFSVTDQTDYTTPQGTATDQTDYTSPQDSVPRVKVKEWGPEFEPVKQVYGQVAKDRADLRILREKHIALFNAETAKATPNYLSLTSGITTDMMGYINNIIDDTAKKMAPAPTRFEIFTMGSMARDESGFFTDLEIGLLVAEKTPEVKRYFEKFAQLLSDRFFVLGEHPDVGGKGLRIDEADNAPLHFKWFGRFASSKQIDDLLDEALRKRKFDKIPFEGSRIFIATPKEFAEYLNPKILDEKTLEDAKKQYKARLEALVETAWQDEIQHLDLANMTDAQRASARAEVRSKVKERFDGVLKPLSRKEYNTAKSLQTLMRNIRHLYGDKELFDEYLKDREVYLQGPPKKANPHFQVNRRQELTYDHDVVELSKPLADLSSPIHGTLGKSVDLKRHLYRFPEQVLTNRGFWYALPVQNQGLILQELVNRGLFNPNFAARVHETINFITGLRLKEQSILRKQGFAIPATPEEWQDTKEDLEEAIANLQNLKDNYIAFKVPQEDIDKVHDKISKAQSELLNLQKMKPLNIGSILTAQEIAELNDKHLPVLKDLYDANIDFLKGNEHAFMREPAPLKIDATQAAVAAEEDKQEFVMPRVKVKEWGPQFEPIKQLYGQAVADRTKLADMREEQIIRFQGEESKENPDYLSLTPVITEATITYINNLVDETAKKLGPPPTEFSLFTMGSMARDESGFYTDLEIGILVDKKDPAVQTYFNNLAQLLSDRFYLLGEHPAVGGKGLRIDEADNAPLHMRWFARYATPVRVQEVKDLGQKLRNKDLKPHEGSRIFLATPEEFAEYLDPNILGIIATQKEGYKKAIQDYIHTAWEEERQKPQSSRRTYETIVKEVHDTYGKLLKPLAGSEKGVLATLSSLARNVRHLYGNKSIFDRYLNERQRYLDGPPSVTSPLYETRRQEIVIQEFTGNILKDLADPSALIHGKLDKIIDIKRKLYRWPEQTLTNLSFWYGLDEQNGANVLRELENRGEFDPVFAKQLRELTNFATGLRLKEQEVLRKQGKTVPLTQEEWAENKADLVEELAYLKEAEAFAVEKNKNKKIKSLDDMAEIEDAHNKVLQVQIELADIDKLKPLEQYSIIKGQDIKLLETKYLPILSELFQRVRAFVEGDRNAFIASAQEFIKKHPKAAEPIVAKPAGIQQPEPIAEPIVAKPEDIKAELIVEPILKTIEKPVMQEPPTEEPADRSFADLDKNTWRAYIIRAQQGYLKITPGEKAQLQDIAKTNPNAKSLLNYVN